MRNFMYSSSASRYGKAGGRRSTGNARKKQTMFNPVHLVKREASIKPKVTYVPTHEFTDFAISDQLKQNVLARGYGAPTPVQDQIIPHALQGKDVVGIANTGTGKTAAFLIPLIEKTMNDRNVNVLIVTPTRELAAQVQDELRRFTSRTSLYSVLCIGGASLGRQISDLRRRPNFVIGTPGRLKDLSERKCLDFADFSAIVLDEVDRMLDMGFIQDINHIVDRLPKNRQSLFFSATVTDNIKKIMDGFLVDPVIVSLGERQTCENINQDVIETYGRGKVEVLHDLLIREGFDKVLVFGRTKRGVERLSQQLHSRGFRVDSIHGDKTQGQRQKALKSFRDNRIQALLATDVASRGLDIDNVTHVINFDLPETMEDYIHRIGRTGRADKTGEALTLV